jgi:hypothetical protein
MTAKVTQPFLQILSERVMRSLKVEAHRLWLARLAVLAFSFRRDLAMEIARLKPAIDVSEADWNLLVSRVFDKTGPDQYLVPTLLRPLLTLPQTQPDPNVVLVASARHIFRTARASSRIDFWDFQSALVALIVAQHYDEAAYHFIVGMATSKRSVPLATLEILFMMLNGQLVHQNLDPLTRFTLLVIEVNTRLLDERTPDYSKILSLMKQMHVVQKLQTLAKLSYAKAMIHMLAVLARLRRLKDNNVINTKTQGRAFASIEAALRTALGQEDATITFRLLEFYGQLHFLARSPDLDLLKHAIITRAPDPTVISRNSLISIYTKFVTARKYDDESFKRCERHSSDYRSSGRADAFFAAEHTIATILIDRFGKYGEARQRIAESSRIANTLGASPNVLRRADLLIADSYWAEKDYINSTKHYESLLSVDFGDKSLTQWVREKLSDSLISQSRFEEAARQLIRALRMNNRRLPPLYKARLYARLAYAYAEGNSLRKASIACLGLRRIAEASASGEIDRLSGIVSGWVLQHFKYSDPAIPKGKVQIRDSSSLSESASAEQIDLWNSLGPPLARELMLLSAIFELLGEFRRSEWLCRKALEAAKRDKDQKRFQKTEHTYQLRLARIQIREHQLSTAAAAFKIAADGLLNLGRQEVAIRTIGGAAYTILNLVEPSFETCSDSEVVQFFDELNGQFASEPGTRAWLLYKETKLLFDRLLVQTARRILLEAEELARSCDEYELQWVLLYSKLFIHTQQMYRDQTLWFRDVLEAGLLLATDTRLAVRRPDFANAVTQVTARFKSAIGEVSSVITEFGSRSNIDPFWVTVFALWKVAKRNRFTIGCLSEVERMLRDCGAIASGDFG